MGRGNPQNLRVLSREEAQKIGRKGGLVKSAKKKQASKLRGIKEKATRGTLKTKDEEYLIKLVTDPEASALNIIKILDSVKLKTGIFDPDLKIKLVNAYTNAHKVIHGQKVHSENVNLNINVEADVEETYNLIKNRGKS